MAEIIKTNIDVSINTSDAASELRKLQQQINAFNLTLNRNNITQQQAAAVWSEGLSNLVNNSKFFRAETVKMQTAAGALDSTLRKGQTTLGQFFSAAFNKRSAMAAETFSLASERVRTMQTQFVATSKAANGMQEAIAIRPLSAFSSQAQVTSERMRILSSMFKQGTTQLINFGKNVQWAGRQLMVGFTVPLTIFGNTAGRVFRELEREVVNFKKVYGDLFTTPDELNQNLEAVTKLANEYTKYGVAVKDTIGLAAEAAAAGRQNTDLTDAVREATRLSTLGAIDQNRALETTIALQSAFRISGEELGNTINFLNMVENQTVVTLQDLAAAIPRVAPVIKGLGGDVKDMAVFLAAMQEGGVSAEQGANALKSGLASLINPTKNAVEVLGQMGINMDAIVQQNRGDLMGTVTSFATALQSLDDFSKQQALEEVFGKFQYARLGALFENIVRDGSQAQQVLDTVGYSTEELRKTAEKELSAIEESIGVQFTGAIERLKLSIAPIGKLFTEISLPIINMLAKIAEAFNGLSEGQKRLAGIATLIIGVVVPAGTMFLGLLMNLLGTLAKMTQGAVIFGSTLLKKGPFAAIQSLTQSSKYLSLAEIDAANAARQLGSATSIVSEAMLSQVGSTTSARAAIDSLTQSYRLLIAEQVRASRVQGQVFGTAAAAGTLAATRRPSRIKSIGLNKGGKVFSLNDGNKVPGVGNTDTVPAMLTPGEFVVNKDSTAKNLNLISAINDGLNVGGQVKNGITYANKSAFITAATGPFSSLVNKTAAKISGSSRTSQAVTRTRKEVPEGSILSKLNNFVYLVDPNINQQLIGNKIMSGFSKRGVPFKDLKKQYLSDDGMWMIDSYSGGKWAKSAYKNTLNENFDMIAKKYSGKEIRFLDGKGMERVKNIVGTPGYENVQFISTKDLHNNKLLSRLTKDHKEKLFSLDTASQMQTRLRSRSGKMEPRPTYVDLTSSSYTKKSKSWRGTKRPPGKQAAHVFNMGGKVPGVQYLQVGNIVKQVAVKGSKALRKSPQLPQEIVKIQKGIRKNPEEFEVIKKILDTDYFNKLRDGAIISDSYALASRGLPIEDITRIVSKHRGSNNLIESGELVFRAAKKFVDNAIKNDPNTKIKPIRLGESRGLGAIPTQIDKLSIDNQLAELGLISRTSIGMARKSSRGHYESFASQAKEKKVRSGYLGQAAYDEVNTGLQQFKNKYGYSIGDTPHTLEGLSSLRQRLIRDLKIDPDFEELLKLNKGGLVPRAVREHMASKYPQMSKDLKEFFEKYITDKRSSPVTMYTKSSQFIADIDNTMRDIARYGERNTLQRLNERMKLNKGNIVPGVGNTDTVPAMLTPGEFVVNKESTRQNYDLLTAINSGTMAGYNKGGKIKNGILYAQQGAIAPEVAERYKSVYGSYPRGYKPVLPRGAGIAGMAAGIGASTPFFSQSMTEQIGMTGSVVASMVAYTVAQKATTAAMGKLSKTTSSTNGLVGAVGKGAAPLAKAFKGSLAALRSILVLNPYTGTFLALATTAVVVTKVLNNIKESGAKLNNAMYGSSESLENMASALGRATPTQQFAQRQAELIAGREISPEAIQMSSEFMKSGQGEQLIKDIQLVGKAGEDQIKALRNQLTSAVMAGVITTEEARQIAVDVGVALKNQNLGVAVSGQISTLLGPEGEKIQKNRISILAEITPSLEIDELKRQTQEQMKIIQNAKLNPFATGYDFGSALQRIVTSITGSETISNAMTLNSLQNNIIEGAKKEAQIRQQINLEYQQGIINFEQRQRDLSSLNVNQFGRESANEYFEQQELSGLRMSLSGGAARDTRSIGSAFADIPRQFGALFTRNTNMPIAQENVKGTPQAVNAAVDFANKTNEEFSQALLDAGLSEERIKILQDFIEKDFGQDMEKIVGFQLDVLSGVVSAAAIDFAERMQGTTTGDMLEQKGMSLLEVGTQLDPLAAQPVLQQRAAGSLARGENVDTLIENYERLQALPPDVIKEFKINLDIPGNVNKFGPFADEILKSWDEFKSLPTVTQDLVLRTATEGGYVNPDKFIKLTDDLKDSFDLLNAVDPKIRKQAQLDVVTSLGGTQEDLTNIQERFKNFQEMSAQDQSFILSVFVDVSKAKERLEEIQNIIKNDPNLALAFSAEMAALGNIISQGEKDLTQTEKMTQGGPTGDGDKSAFQRIMEETRATDKYTKATGALVKSGLKPESVALINQADLLEMTVTERKKAIQAVENQTLKQKALAVVLTSTEDQNIRNLRNAVEIKNREISLIERQIEDVERLNRVEENRIDKLQRQNELDSRQTDIRNRALDMLSRKEDDVNKVYDARFEALDKVAQINDRVAQQQQDRISLATALTGGDIAAAASAAATMAQNFATSQEQDTRRTLENQRESELSALTETVNGQLLTRAQIEQQIEEINDRVYNRNLQIIALEDVIFERNIALQPQLDRINQLTDARVQLTRDLEDAEWNKNQNELNMVNKLIEAYKRKYEAATKGTGNLVSPPPRVGGRREQKAFGGVISKYAMGGMINKYAMGGMVNFTGSREAPPAIKMAMGSVVPGLGNTDRVPALLTPGEFVIRKSVAEQNMGLLKALNGDVFPQASSLGSSVSSDGVNPISNSVVNSMPVYNSYSINVNVPNTNASPDEIANVVAAKLRRTSVGNIRGSRF